MEASGLNQTLQGSGENLIEFRTKLMLAALGHVPLEGWHDECLRRAVADIGANPTLARAACPRGAVDLALSFHDWGDERMVELLDAADLSTLRFRDRVAAAIKLRLEAVEDHKEAVRRGTTLFSMPFRSAEGGQAIWSTADRIWVYLDDRSDDLNWYTKRMTLATVLAATVLYWLGDNEEGFPDTREFVDRRIDDVMQIEKVKGRFKKSPIFQDWRNWTRRKGAQPFFRPSPIRRPGMNRH